MKKTNKEALRVTYQYKELYNQSIIDEELNNMLDAVNKMLNKLELIKKNITLEKFYDIDKTLKEYCDNLNKKHNEIQDNEKHWEVI